MKTYKVAAMVSKTGEYLEFTANREWMIEAIEDFRYWICRGRGIDVNDLSELDISEVFE